MQELDSLDIENIAAGGLVNVANAIERIADTISASADLSPVDNFTFWQTAERQAKALELLATNIGRIASYLESK